MDAKSPKALTVTLPSDREIAFTRVFDAPRELVWKAWTDPKHRANWYGCGLMTLVACEIDLRVGGAYRFVMRSQDGEEFSMSGGYREVVAPHRLVYTERFNDDPNKEALVTFTLEEHRGKTTLRMIARYRSAADTRAVLQLGVEHGWTESLDRLDGVLRAMEARAA